MGGRPMAELVQVVQARYPIKIFISKYSYQSIHIKIFKISGQNIRSKISGVASSNLCIKPRIKYETGDTPKSSS
jgi:hypothetical protein